MHLVVYWDGGSRGNPGPSGSGVFITDALGNVVERRYLFIGHGTNNRAEYTAAKLWLERAIALGALSIELKMDSKLVIEQLAWRWKVKHPEIRVYVDEIKALLKSYNGKIVYTHIPREANSEADRLANKAMDEAH